MTTKLALLAGASAAIVACSIGAAMASETVGTRSAFLYSGPGSNYQVVDRLTRGDDVRVVRQRGPWCFVRADGPDGWLKCTVLIADESFDDDYGPQVTFQFGFGGGFPTGHHWMGGPHGPMGGPHGPGQHGPMGGPPPNMPPPHGPFPGGPGHMPQH